MVFLHRLDKIVFSFTIIFSPNFADLTPLFHLKLFKIAENLFDNFRKRLNLSYLLSQKKLDRLMKAIYNEKVTRRHK